MASTHIQQHVKMVMVPKGNFKSEIAARKHIEELGYQANAKPVHITDNYYKYSQGMPTASDHGNMAMPGRAIYGRKNIIIDQHKNMIIKDPSLQQNSREQKKSAYNPQPIVGANGHGIWKPEYQTPILGKDGHGQRQLPPYLMAPYRSMQTGATPLKPWDPNANGASQMQMTQSYYNLKGGKKQKYF